MSEQPPRARLALTGWLLEKRDVPRKPPSSSKISKSFPGKHPSGEWRNPAAIVALSMGNYRRCITLWEDLIKTSAAGQLPPAMYSLPFLTLNPFWSSPDEYPMSQVGATMRLIQGLKSEGSILWYQVALAQLELGASTKGAIIVESFTALELNPLSPVRPLLRFYLENLTGEQIEMRPTVPEADQFADLSEPETAAEEKSDAKAESKPEVKPDKPVGNPPRNNPQQHGPFCRWTYDPPPLGLWGMGRHDSGGDMESFFLADASCGARAATLRCRRRATLRLANSWTVVLDYTIPVMPEGYLGTGWQSRSR